ncbi:hypothetical protein MHYP_G00130120 [Metynnis hypsauchen]
MLFPQSFCLSRVLRALMQTEWLNHVLKQPPADKTTTNTSRADVEVSDDADVVALNPELLQQRLHSGTDRP